MTNRTDKSLNNQIFLFNSHHTVKDTTEFVRNIFDFLLLYDEILLDLVYPDVEPPDVHLRVLRPRVVRLQLRLQLPDLFLQFILPLQRSLLGHLDSSGQWTRTMKYLLLPLTRSYQIHFKIILDCKSVVSHLESLLILTHFL